MREIGWSGDLMSPEHLNDMMLVVEQIAPTDGRLNGAIEDFFRRAAGHTDTLIDCYSPWRGVTYDGFRGVYTMESAANRL